MKNISFLLLIAVLFLALSACTPQPAPAAPTDPPASEPLPTVAVEEPTWTPEAPEIVEPTQEPAPEAAPTEAMPAEETAPEFVSHTVDGAEPLGFVAIFGEAFPEPWQPGTATFTSDGSIVAHVGSSHFRLYDTETFVLIQTLGSFYPNLCPQDAGFDSAGDFFAVSLASCTGGGDQPHILVFDLSSGQVTQDIKLSNAAMSDETYGEFSIPVSAMTFLPDSPRLAYANGNTVVIRNVLTPDVEPEVIQLDEDMYASQLSVRDDGEYLFVLMNWQKSADEASPLVTPRLQSWHLPSLSLNLNRWMDDMVNPGEYMLLVEDYLVHGDPFNAAIYGLSLKDETPDEFPYRDGQTFFSSDMHYMLYFRPSGTTNESLVFDNLTGLEIDNFSLDIPAGWDVGVSDFVFSPDATMLAIEHNSQLSLYSLFPLVVVDTP